MSLSPSIRNYLATIGRKGGQRSRRSLSTEQARDMVRVREARKAFKQFYTQCFWYLREDMTITLNDVPEIITGLKRHGGRRGFLIASKLCP